MKQVGIPVIPGSEEKISTLKEATRAASELGYPVMIKASEGGGGRGIRIARNEKELKRYLPLARSESKAFFDSDEVFIEKYIEAAHHIEFQILADHHGSVVHLGERECSIQRRHQKVVEESPSVIITPEIRAADGVQMGDEGCLSFPGITLEIERPNRVTVEAHDLDGAQFTLTGEGLMARALCHEIAHLDGKTFLDALSPLKREMLKRQIRKRIKTGDCVIDDDMKSVYSKLLSADGIVVGTPVYFWTVTAQAKLFMDRLYALGNEEGYGLRGKKIGIILTWGRFITWLSFFLDALAGWWLSESEERQCLQRFGPEYEAYRARTWLLFPGERFQPSVASAKLCAL
jgi:peptide deformylase